MPNDHRTDIRAYAQETERTMQSALWHAQGLCPACGEDPDYCQGHGPIGDPVGAAILDEFPQDEDAWGWFAGWALDVEHTVRTSNTGLDWFDEADPEETRLAIGLGGPTVRVTYSHRYDRADLSHSWGEFNGEDRTTWEMDPETVREFVETFAPHPLGWEVTR